jgi:outer membrane protein assembly factor BamB
VTPVVHKDLLFLWQDRGVVSCHLLATGKLLWRERVGGSFSGSPVRVGRHLYCISDDGEVVVLAAADRFAVVGRVPLDEPSRATPAVSAETMYLRTESHLMALGGRAP